MSSEQVSAVNYAYGNSNQIFAYSYDKLGNIASITKDNQAIASYNYDEVGQLTRVNDAQQNKTFTYTYDVGGNINQKKEYVYTTGALGSPTNTITYAYGDANWKDKLTTYDGKAITYDGAGNPLTYNGKTFTWECRRLKSVSGITFRYDDSDIRTQKANGSTITDFTTVDGRITSQTTNEQTTFFRYDESGNLISLNWNGAEYFYVLNIQGDVIFLLDEQGNVVVEYTYDAWGAPLSITGSLAATLGAANPFRYRSYYWDSEIGLYYLQSRYYSPEWGRFVNADEPSVLLLADEYLVGPNLFAYCYNNPANYSDPTGHIAIVDDLLFLYIIITTVVVVGLVLIGYMSTSQFKQSWRSFYTGIDIGLRSLWNRIMIRSLTPSQAVAKAIERNTAKAKEITKKKQGKDYYWIASKVTYKRKSVSRTTYFPSMPISRELGAAYVRNEGNVFANTDRAARRLAIAINGAPPVGPEIHGDGGLGFFRHYHARNRIGAGNGGGHVFYILADCENQT